MLTIRAEVQKDKLRSDGTYNVKIRFTLDRVVKRLSTSIFVTPRDITKSFKIKEFTPLKKEIDNLVRCYQHQCSKLQLELNSYTLDDIIDHLNGEREKTKSIDFILFSHEWIASTDIKGKKNYATAINTLVAFIGKDTLDINKVTKNLLQDFTDYLNSQRTKRIEKLKEQGERIPSNRAPSLYLGSIRHLHNEAKKKYNDYDRNIILISNSPFENFKVPKPEATRKRALSAEQIRAIYSLPYRHNAKGQEMNCSFNLAKDCFILSFCLIGMNTVDLYECTDHIEDTITYYRTKTRGRRSDDAKMVVDIPKFIQTFIVKYADPTGRKLFNFYRNYSTASCFNKSVNNGLKEIGAILGIDDLEYYAARHTWATLALNKVGIDKYTVHAALNHIDESMKVTDIYIDRDFVNENKANAKVVKYVFGAGR